MNAVAKTAIVVIALASLGSSSFAFAKGNSGTGSSHSLQNSNGKYALDRDKGLDRAADRRNEKSLKTKSRKNRSPAPTFTR